MRFLHAYDTHKLHSLLLIHRRFHGCNNYYCTNTNKYYDKKETTHTKTQIITANEITDLGVNHCIRYIETNVPYPTHTIQIKVQAFHSSWSNDATAYAWLYIDGIQSDYVTIGAANGSKSNILSGKLINIE